MKRARLTQYRSLYQFRQTPSTIKAFFSNRKHDVSFHHQPVVNIAHNRAKVLGEMNTALTQLTCGQQVHSDCVRIVKRKDKGKGASVYAKAFKATDALITNEENIALAVFAADCLPIIVVEKKLGVIAAIHAGWKSTHKHIVQKTIRLMQKEFTVNPKDVSAFFGPALRKCCYEVGEEFLRYFPKTTMRKKGKVFFDLIQENYLQLKNAGVPSAQMFDAGFCTSCNNNVFFSFRREKDACGRQMAVVMMKGAAGNSRCKSRKL